MALQLVIHEDGHPARTIPASDQMLIGRGAECTLHLEDGSVSTRHARILRVDGGLWIEDLGGKNKTVIEGGVTLTSGQRAALSSGMSFWLGRVRIGVEDAGAQGDLPSTAPNEPELEATLTPSMAGELAGEATVIPGPVPAASAPRMPVLPADSNTFVPPAPDADLAAHAFFQESRPRLVLDCDAFRQVVPIDRSRFTIGRSMGELALQHPMLSNPHAQIFYQAQTQRLFLEDKQSKNGTFLNQEALLANRPREIPQQAYLRFGTVDALFLMDKGYDGVALATERRRELAIQILVQTKKLAPARRKLAEEEARKRAIPLEAALIVTGAIHVPDWVQALEDARIKDLVPDQGRSLKIVIGVLLVLVLGLVALLLWKLVGGT